jgi:hypothetical protein
MMDEANPEAYADVFTRFEREGIRYVVTSGVAVVLHGHVRPIADLDVVIDASPGEAERALRALAGCGFVPSIPLPLTMLTVLRMFDHSGREADVFVRYHIPFDQLWANSRRVDVGDCVARIVSLEHLLLAKRINGRPHDLSDIAALLALGAGSQGPTPA